MGGGLETRPTRTGASWSYRKSSAAVAALSLTEQHVDSSSSGKPNLIGSGPFCRNCTHFQDFLVVPPLISCFKSQSGCADKNVLLSVFFPSLEAVSAKAKHFSSLKLCRLKWDNVFKTIFRNDELDFIVPGETLKL